MNHDVEQPEAGRRLDQLLGDLPQIGSRSHAERLLRDGMVQVNGRNALKSTRLKLGDVIAIEDSALKVPPPVVYDGLDLPILYQDDDVIVIDKPAGIVVHPAPGHRSATLVERLVAAGVALAPNEDEMFNRPGVLHRLDKDTSGVILLAKNAKSLRTLQVAMRGRQIRREYLALVNGHTPSRAGRIEAPIGRDHRDATKRSIDTDDPKDAITHFVVQEILPTTMLLRMRLETGRTHQIRVHLKSIGHNVIGDPTYGDSNAPTFGLERQFLHAARLVFPHPQSGEDIEVTAPLPEDLTDALAAARRLAPVTRR